LDTQKQRSALQPQGLQRFLVQNYILIFVFDKVRHFARIARFVPQISENDILIAGGQDLSWTPARALARFISA
jgi:hypothetical protein